MFARRRLLTKRYIGPGDIIPGAVAWYSTARAYSRAFAQQRAPVMDLQKDPGGTNPITIYMLPNGYVDLNAIANWIAVNSVSTARIAKLYDQTGNGLDVTQATLAAMPTLTLNSLGGLPGFAFVAGSNTVMATAGNVTTAQPLTFSAVSMRTVAATGGVIASASATVFLGSGASANIATVFGTSAINQTASDNAFHALQGVLNSASSIMVVDGTASSTASSGGTAMSGTLRLGRTNAAVSMTGTIMEAGLWPIAFGTGQYADMNSNQHGTGGYNF